MKHSFMRSEKRNRKKHPATYFSNFRHTTRNGCCVINPHSDISKSYCTIFRLKESMMLYTLNATDETHLVYFNPIANILPRFHTLATSHIIAAFKSIWVDSWGPRLEHVLRFSIRALLTCPNTSVLDVQKLLTDTSFRNHVLSHVADQVVLDSDNHRAKYL